MATSAKVTASAAQFVDDKLHTAANAVERFANIVTATTTNADGDGFGQKLGDPIGRQLNKTVERLRAQNGEAIVDGVKDKMLLYPKATVGIAAAVGAIAAQAALMMLKGERPANANAPIRPLSVKSAAAKKRKPKKPETDAVRHTANEGAASNDD